MKFSVITPSFRNSDWLKLCIASVADQEGVEHEHIVQDSCSEDGTQDWLPQDARVRAFIEKDAGMYDAVNRGLRQATGDFAAYLNCDEQYLPGALAAVARCFAEHPETDVILADSIVVNAEGEYLCHRCSLKPTEASLWVRLPVLTSSLFFRRSVFSERGIEFDPQWRDLGDFFFVRELVRRGCHLRLLPVFTSIFTDTGDNMNLKPNAVREKKLKAQMTPGWIRSLSPLLLLRHRWQMWRRGAYTMRPFDFSLYTHRSPQARVVQHARRPTPIWPGR